MTMAAAVTPFEKAKFCAVLLLGCNRATACNLLGVAAERLHAEMERDAAFAVEVLRAEAQAEVDHMRNVRAAALDEKNWRGSVWWLERRDRTLDAAEDLEPWQFSAAVREALGRLVEIVLAEVVDPIRRQAIINELQATVGEGASEIAKPQAAGEGE